MRFPGRCDGPEKSYGPSKTRKYAKIAILEPECVERSQILFPSGVPEQKGQSRSAKLPRYVREVPGGVIA